MHTGFDNRIGTGVVHRITGCGYHRSCAAHRVAQDMARVAHDMARVAQDVVTRSCAFVTHTQSCAAHRMITGCGMPDPVRRTGCGSQSAQDVVAGCTGYDAYILICVLCTGYGYHVAVTVHHGGMTLPRKPGRLP